MEFLDRESRVFSLGISPTTTTFTTTFVHGRRGFCDSTRRSWASGSSDIRHFALFFWWYVVSYACLRALIRWGFTDSRFALVDLPKWICGFLNSRSALGKFGAHRGEFVRVARCFAPFFGGMLRALSLLYGMMPGVCKLAVCFGGFAKVDSWICEFSFGARQIWCPSRRICSSGSVFRPVFGEISRVFPLLYVMMPVGGIVYFYEFDFLDLGGWICNLAICTISFFLIL